jgi:hypothetical protein
MSILNKMRLQCGGAFLLCLVLVSGTYSYEGGGSGVRHAQWVEIEGRILAVSAAGEARPANPPRSSAAYYLLLHRRGHLVIQGLSGQPVLPYHRLWLKGDDQAVDKLLSEEQLFVEIRLSGLLREYLPDVGILNLGHIEVVPVRSHGSAVVADPGS